MINKKLLAFVAVLLVGAQTYAASGMNHLWSVQYGGSYGGSAWDVTHLEAGGFVMVGDVHGDVDFGGGVLPTVGASDALVVRFDSDGSHVWSRSFGGAGFDRVRRVAIDRSANIVITGDYSEIIDFGGGLLPVTPSFAQDLFVAKIDNSGSHIWSRGFGNDLIQVPTDVATDGRGNVIVVGYFKGQLEFDGFTLNNPGTSTWDSFIVKLDPHGHVMWVRGFGDNDGSPIISGVTVDRGGAISVVGTFNETVDLGGGTLSTAGINDTDLFVAQFDANGVHSWSRAYGDWDSQNATDIDSDQSGNILIAGHFRGLLTFGSTQVEAEGSPSTYVAKLTRSGEGVWAFASRGSGKAYIDRLRATTDGGAVISAKFRSLQDFGAGLYSSVSSDQYDIAIAAYDMNGQPAWTSAFGGPLHNSANALSVSERSELVAVGVFDGTISFGGAALTNEGSWDIFVAAFDTPISPLTLDIVASRFAPVIYQDTSILQAGGKYDLITSLDFDGDGVIANNWESAESLSPSAFTPHVYYSMTETRTHYFLGYYFYHPRDWDPPTHEHDLEGITVVVKKPGTEIGHVVGAFTEAHDDIYYFLPASSSAVVPDQDDGGWCLVSGSPDHRDHGLGNWLCDAFVEENTTQYFTDRSGQSRPAAFVEAGGHGVGHINRALGAATTCGAPDVICNEVFHDSDGVIYAPSETGTPTPPPSPLPGGITTLEYALLPFDAQIFANRWNPNLFDPAEATSITTIRGAYINAVGVTFLGGGAHSPWFWPELRDSNAPEVVAPGSRGDWLLDPAWMMQEHLDLQPLLGSAWDTDYLHNPYLFAGNTLIVATPPSVNLEERLTISWTHEQVDPLASTALRGIGDLNLINATSFQRASEIAAGTAMSSGSYEWTVPSTIGEGEYRIELSCAATIVGNENPPPALVSVSDAFTIVGPTSAPPVVHRTRWLGDAHPNPFNPKTTIQFVLPEPGLVELAIFDAAGRRVTVLVDRTLPAGDHRANWDGRDAQGRRVASGVYFYQLRVGDHAESKRMVLIK